MTKVLVGMSGGIDSSVVAYKLKSLGYNVSGVTMSVWKADGKYQGNPDKNSCFSPDKTKDIKQAEDVCNKLGIDLKVVDISDLYESVVLNDFRNEYLNGRTPNPCVWCNQKIKFGAMVDMMKKGGLEFDYFATGHYARIVNINGRYAVQKAVDSAKDQSYFLYRLNQDQLSHTMFPLGELTKQEVRQVDVEQGFHPQGQKESQDFYSGHYTDLLDVQPKEGNIVDTDGKILGKHNGMWNYTIGQRKGLGVSAPQPLYVIALDPVKNEVVVGYEDKTGNTGVCATNIVWQAVESISEPIRAFAKIRSTGLAVPCTVYMDSHDNLCADFDSPVKAATCGQSLVVYDRDDIILCGGIINKVK